MKNFLRIASGVNVTPLALALQRQPQLWNANDQRRAQENGAHADTSDIWVRYNRPGPDLARMADEHDSVWYPAYYHLPELRPLIFGLMATVEGERLGGVLLTKVPAGKRVLPHTDDSWHVRYYDKFYLSVHNPKGCRFFCEDEAVEPAPGDVWWFDNTHEHWVENDGDDDRVTLIVCIRTHRYGDRHVG